MIRIAIVEDEESYVSVLKGYLARYEEEFGEQLEVTVFHDGDEITANYRARFDIILMDIEMRFVGGMTAAEEIRQMDSAVTIIFITNNPQYAIRGYEVGALDYVLKPVSYFVFSQKVNRAVLRIKRTQKKWLTVRIKNGVKRIEVSDIYYIESEGHYLKYHTKKETVESYDTIKSVEAAIADRNFFRINKCYLINLEYVEGVKERLAVVHGEELLVSRSRMKPFMQELTRYWGERL